MAKSLYDDIEYAIKFFVSRAAFDAELAMYDCRGGAQTSSLAQFLPKVKTLLLCYLICEFSIKTRILAFMFGFVCNNVGVLH
jgi:hypothetical protein